MPGKGKTGRQSYPSESVASSRKDSGFAESREGQSEVPDSKPYTKTLVDESIMAPGRTVTPEQRSSAESYGQDMRRQGSPTALTHHPPFRDYQSSISTASRATSRYTNSLSRKSTGSYRTPRPSLIHSANSSHRPPSVYNKARPAMSIRTNSAPPTHSPVKDPLTFHRNSCRLFQSRSPSLAYHQCSSGASTTEGLTDIDIGSLPHGSIPTRLTTAPTSDGLDSSSTAASPIEPTPPTIIDWTSTATRRREYERIDRSHRGLRGWWRRIAPRWCQRSRSSRISFYDGDSDAGSVRRYRIPLADESEGGEDDGLSVMEKCASAKVREVQRPPSLVAASRQNSWSCFNFRNR